LPKKKLRKRLLLIRIARKRKLKIRLLKKRRTESHENMLKN